MDDPAARPRPRAIVLSDRHPHWSEGKPAGNVGPQWAVLLALLLGEARAAPWLRDLPGDAGDLPRAPANVAGHREAIRGLEKRGAVSRTGGALSLTCSSDVVEALSTPEPDPLALARLFEAIDWILRKLDLDPAREEEAGLASIRMALVGYLARWQVALGHKAGPRPIDFPNGSKLKRLSLRRPWLS